MGPVNANPNNDPNGARQDTLFNWNVGIVYKPIRLPPSMRRTRPPPIRLDRSWTRRKPTTAAWPWTRPKPEKNTAIEVGTKWELFNRRLLATVALFQTEKENAREPNPLGGTNPPTSSGAFRVRGVEFGAQGKVTERWSVYGGLVVTKPTDQSSTPAFVDRELANIPKTQFNLLSKYQLTHRLSVGGQAIYASEVFGGLFAVANEGNHIPAHWRFDLLSEYKFSDNFSAQLNVINITNELYYDLLIAMRHRLPLWRRAGWLPDAELEILGVYRSEQSPWSRQWASGAASQRGGPRCRRINGAARYPASAQQAASQTLPPGHGRGGVGRWTRHGWTPIRLGKAQHAIARGLPAAEQLGAMILEAIFRSPAIHFCRNSHENIPAAVQSLWCRPAFRHPCRRGNPGRPVTLWLHRTDLSVTRVLAEPEEYDGGELAVEDKYGVHEVKLPAGDMVLYPATSLHHVNPVLRGMRIASFFLAAKHDPRRRRALLAVRPRPDHPGAFDRARRGGCGVRAADRYLPQPDPLLADL